MDLSDLNTIKNLLKKHGIWAKKGFGQNFLIEKSVVGKSVEAAGVCKEDYIIEVGPGIGILTKELATYGKKVTAIELDQSLLPVLKETLHEFKNIEIINQDALEFIPPSSTYKIVANIPYYITSPLLNHFLQASTQPQSITLLVQKEVAEKVCADAGDHSILSLQVQLFGYPKIITKIKSSSFFPAPKVESAILHIEIYKKSDENYVDMEKAKKILSVAKRAFSGKRKKLSNTLPDKIEILKTLGLQDKRPQHLGIKEWEEIITNPGQA